MNNDFLLVKMVGDNKITTIISSSPTNSTLKLIYLNNDTPARTSSTQRRVLWKPRKFSEFGDRSFESIGQVFPFKPRPVWIKFIPITRTIGTRIKANLMGRPRHLEVFGKNKNVWVTGDAKEIY